MPETPAARRRRRPGTRPLGHDGGAMVGNDNDLQAVGELELRRPGGGMNHQCVSCQKHQKRPDQGGDTAQGRNFSSISFSKIEAGGSAR